MPSDDQHLQKISDQVIEGKVIENTEDIKSLATAVIKNYASLIPFAGPGISAGIEYYQSKVARKREEEVNFFLENLNRRLSAIEVKQEAIDYFESSLIFRLEDIQQKLLANPGKGYDEVLAEFVASALTDLDTPSQTKDLILSTLLSLDSVDIKVLKELDRHFVENLDPSKTNTGVTRDSLYTLLKDSKLDAVVISRSLQRLQAQYLIQPLNTSTASIQEVPHAEDLYWGARSPQFDSPSGFANTDFGRKFLMFLNIGATPSRVINPP